MAVGAGDTIGGRYVVEQELAGGGMGKLFVARHRDLGSRVAIKVLHADRATDPASVERFRREARAASRIRGQHVARVLDVGDSDEHGPFIVMEYVEGRSLSAALAEHGPFAVAIVVEYVLQACEALADAHRIGIVHRDLKPSNLLLTEAPDGAALIKVTDFGIAKVPATKADALTLTEAGVLGSPRYMSPEQILDPRTVDARSDIWSLGIVLYELVSGKIPFDAYTTSGLLARIVSEAATPIHTHLPAVDPDFEALVMRCLAKDPAARFETVSELAEALGSFAPGGAASAGRVRRIRESPHSSDSAPIEIAPAIEEPARTPGSATEMSSSTVQPIVVKPRRRYAWALAAGVALPGAALGMAALTRGPTTVPTAAAAPRETAPAVSPVLPAPSTAPVPPPVEAVASLPPVVAAPVAKLSSRAVARAPSATAPAPKVTPSTAAPDMIDLGPR